MFVYNISYCTLNLKIYVVVEAGNKQNITKRSLLMVEEIEIRRLGIGLILRSRPRSRDRGKVAAAGVYIPDLTEFLCIYSSREHTYKYWIGGFNF